MKNFTRIGWVFGLRGLFAVLFAVVALLSPGHTLRMLILLFGCYALADGLFALWFGLQSTAHKEFMRASLLEGVIGIGLGTATLFMPQITEIAVGYLVAAWAVLTGIFGLFAVDRTDHVTLRGWPLSLFGVVSVIVGSFLFVYPQQGSAILIILLGSYSLVFGMISLHLAWRLFRHHRPHSGPRGLHPIN